MLSVQRTASKFVAPKFAASSCHRWPQLLSLTLFLLSFLCLAPAGFAQTLTNLTLNPTSGFGGSTSVTGTVTLSAAASAATTVTLSSSDQTHLAVPASVSIGAGSTSATFTGTSHTVAAVTMITVTATYSGVSKTATFTDNPTAVSSVTFSPTSVVGGSANSTGTVHMTGAVGSAQTITLTSSNTAALTVPASVSLPASNTLVNFTATSHTVTTPTTVTVTASYNGGSKTGTVTVNPAAAASLSSVSVNPTSVTGGNSSTGTVTLSSAAPSGGAVVTLSSNNASAAVPASVTVASGATTATFTATTSAVTASATATLTATYSSVSKTATLTVVPPALSGVSVSPGSVTGGTSATGTAMLTGKVATGASVVVSLTSSNTAAATVPTSVTIPAGSSSATFPVTTSTVAAATNVTLTATYSSVSKTIVLTVNPAASSSLRIDTGATATYTDSLGNVWSIDQYSSGGTVEAPGSPPSIANTADPKLFQTQRVETTAGSKITYTLPIANGTYSLNLLFAEIDGKTTGQRVFNVTANGTTLLSGFDIFAAAGGANKAITKSFLVTVTTGQIVLVFTGTTGQAAISAISVAPPGGGTPVADIPAPGWAEEVIPSDQSDAGGAGPSSSLSVSLPSGVLENHPGPDLDVFNPVGPSISYERLYRSALAAAGTYTPGLSPGWRDNYSLTITNKGSGNYTLNYPNGGAENWTTVSGTITPPSGAPYLVNVSGTALVMTFKDHSYYTYTLDPGNANNYLLTGLSNLAGSTVTINRDSANGNRITTFTNGGPSPLLTLNYSASGLANITDVYGRVVTYTFTSSNLATVSQVNAASAIRWQYGYTTIGTKPYLNAVMVPDPSSGSMSEADPQYAADGHVASLKDAEGNQRTYNYGPKAVSVSIYGTDNTLTQTWTQKFDSANRNVDKGVIDAYGHATSLAYADSANPLKVTAATNKNNQTASAAFDKYGNTTAVTDLRNVQTQNTYDPAFPLGQVAEIAVGANQPTPKTPTNFTYYDGTTQVGGITQPKGLVKTMSVPTPGTTGTGDQVTTTYAYTSLGDVLMVASPAPASSGTVTTTYNYTLDTTYDVNGNAGSYTTTERLGQPLTITDPLGNVTHFRYDARGNALTVITPPVVRYPDTSTARGLRTDYGYNRYDQLTGVMYPPTNPATPTARATAIYTYKYEGGPLQAVTYYDESGTQVRTAGKGDGKEDEQKSQAGSIQQANYNYDPRFRLTQKVDGVHSQPAQSFAYDGVGNLTSQKYALGDGPQFTQYDNDNNLMQMKDGRSVSTSYTRSADDSRITGVSYSDGTPAVNFGTNGSGYDVYDRVTSFSDGAGTYTATYDDDDNLLSKTTTYTGLPAATVSYSYNNDGSQATLTTPQILTGGAYSYWTFSYVYDNDGRMTAVICPWQQSRTSSSHAQLNYSYDNDGRLIKTHTRQTNTYNVYNARGYLVELQHVNNSFVSQFTNGDSSSPPAGTISSGVAQGSGGDTSNCLLDDYLMQYDSVGNRTQTAVTIPDLWQYNSSGTALFSFPTAPDVDGTLTYIYDAKDRLTLETTNNSGGTPTMEDYGTSGGGELYNDNWNYPTGGDLADNLTTVRGTTQTFNADDQLMGQTYDGEGNQTSYNGGTMIYDAEDRPTFVPGGNGTTGFSQLFTGEGLRAWKLPSGGSKTYYLYSGDQALMELDSSGNPVITYAYGADGLQERYQHTNSGIPFIVYLFDPTGNLVHRVRRDDPDTSSGDAVFAQDTAIYDSQGLLHADIDTISGGFNQTHLDPVGYKGQSGNYTDLETLQAASGLYTALSGPVGANFYNPMSGVGMARSQSDSINTYLDNLNPLAGYTFGEYAHDVGQFGIGEGKAFGNTIVGGAVDTGKLALEASGPVGALLADQVPPGWSSPFAAGNNPMQQSGFDTGGKIALVGSIAAIAVGDPEGVETLAGAEREIATTGGHCFVAGTLVQMADGSTRPIEQVRVGDLVKSRNPQTGVTEAKRVDRTYVRVAPQVLTLTFTDAQTHQTQVFTCTPEHPFFVDGKGYVAAGQLGIGTSIVTRAGPCLTLSAANWNAPVGLASGSGLVLDGQAHPAGVTVYNLRVEDDHSYFVGTQSGGICVHNADYDLQTIADEVFSVGGKKPQQQTISAVRTADGQIVVASNGSEVKIAGIGTGKFRRAYLSRKQQAVVDRYQAVYARGARYGNSHAEQNAIGHAEQVLNTRSTEIAASNRVCLPCQRHIEGKGIISRTPNRGY